MGLVTTGANWTLAVAKQTNESTIGTVAAYSFPVYGDGGPVPNQDYAVVEVTDAAAIQGDPYKQSGESWSSTIGIPAYAASLGTLIGSMWPTDTISGAGPYVHTFSGLGGTQPWMSMFQTKPGLVETFEAGLCSGISFSFDENGGPLKVTHSMVGKRPTAATTYTVTTAETLANGFFTATGGTLKYEADNATPVTSTNVRSATVTVARNVGAEKTADGVSVAFLSQGRVAPSITMSMLYTDWEMYRATYYGAVAGTTPSATTVTGSVELNFVHSVTGTWALKLTVPKVALTVLDPPKPDPAGGPMLITVDGKVFKPAAGDHIQPVLTNGVTPAY